MVIDLGIQRQNRNQWQIMALANRIVIKVMRGCDLDAAGTKFQIDIAVGDDGDFTIGQRQLHHLADQVLIARVFRMHHHGGIAEHGFRARGGDSQ